MDKSEKIILFILLGSVAACLIVAVLTGAIMYISSKIVLSEPTAIAKTSEPTVAVCEVTPKMTKVSVNVDNELMTMATETQHFLQITVIPTADLNVLAGKFYGKTNIPIRLDTPPQQFAIGDKMNFYKLNDVNESVLTSATLRYATDNAYFWAEDNLILDKRELKNLMDTFSNEIYPINQEFFGKEWLPGVDNDPHLYILYAGGLGSGVAGHVVTTDTVLPIAHEYSNAKEMFTINSDVQTLSDPYTLSTMAHELQHLIHGYHDPNEELWLNEGFSELATLLNGYDAGGFDVVFSYDPDMQLNDWSDDADLSNSNYGASFLYTTYLLDRFGEEVTRAVVADPMNGFASVDNVFNSNDIRDPLTEKIVTADDFFTDWTITNFLQDSGILDGRYHYSNYMSAPKVDVTETFYECTGVPQIRTVHQYGTDYFQISCGGKIQLQFSGDATVGVLPDSAQNDGFMMWSNRADTSDMMMTREFDFTNLSGKIDFTFDTWYELETDFDYVYLMASVDDRNWKILKTPSCTSINPSGNSYGCGYNALTSGWQTERVDLSSYAGKKVALRFEYITDGAISGEGFAIDNLKIPKIGYAEGFEESNGGWTVDGFVRLQNIIPQTFLVSLINEGSMTPIQKFHVAPGEELNLEIDTTCFTQDPVLVVSASSRYTRQIATYTLKMKSN
ncbi:MAG: hypothetical protein FD147_1269 [Chloroflexi bacterium]|nr:MAG: hypothetical protein FD147_1269 [Chloroflexota bacterium]